MEVNQVVFTDLSSNNEQNRVILDQEPLSFTQL